MKTTTTTKMKSKTLLVSSDDHGVRLDRLVRKELRTIPLSTIYQLIRKGKIRVNGKRAKENYRVQSGDTLFFAIVEMDPKETEKKDGKKIDSLFRTPFYRENFKILFEDENLLVCNKPVGLVVHSGTGHVTQKTLIDLAICYVRNTAKSNTSEPILVHRLDRDTSGVILIAKNKQILRSLHTAIRQNEIEKKYRALCHGFPTAKKGTLDFSLMRTFKKNSGTKVTVSDNGVRAVSTYRVIHTKKNISSLEVTLHTGRTHQIRVHLAHIHCPIIGDVRYGNKDLDRVFFSQLEKPERLYLHAEQISFFYPSMQKKVTFVAPVPNSFR